MSQVETTQKAAIIEQGAEAKVTRIRYLGQNAVLKTRMIKRYRHPEMDQELSNKRVLSETRIAARLRKNGVLVPLIYLVDLVNRHIVYEYINGDTIMNIMERVNAVEKASILQQIGVLIAKMHDANVIHGDLTPRNMMRAVTGDIYLIDFGLSYVSTSVEDKGVDLYVLERCCSNEQFKGITDAYRKQSKNGAVIMAKLEEVRMRGRKRDLSG